MNAITPKGFESALDWNRRHPPGTHVQVKLSDGRNLATTTASWATQWGSFAVLSLERVPGLWTISALVPVADLFATHPSTPPAPIAYHASPA